jgi:hypothetical protein
MCRVAVDIAAGEGKARAHGELMGRARWAAEDDFGGKNVARKPRQGRDLDPQKFAKRVADPEMMRRDMEWDVFHDLVGVGV